jgi:hypothetical protein
MRHRRKRERERAAERWGERWQSAASVERWPSAVGSERRAGDQRLERLRERESTVHNPIGHSKDLKSKK